MKVTVTLELDVTPGTYSAEQVKADVVSQLTGDANMLGFGFGPEPYQVNSVKAA